MATYPIKIDVPRTHREGVNSPSSEGMPIDLTAADFDVQENGVAEGRVIKRFVTNANGNVECVLCNGATVVLGATAGVTVEGWLIKKILRANTAAGLKDAAGDIVVGF